MIPPCPPELCCGCSACVDACPVQALSFREGADTYLHVEVDASKCIGCGKCAAVCPQVNPPEGCGPRHAFAAVHRKEAIRHGSSSGGAFSAVVEAIADKDGGAHSVYVCGAEMTDAFKVRHRCVKYTEPDDLAPFRKSKYICSDCSGIYREVGNLLAERKNLVVFSGTPCQVAALRSSLGTSSSRNLIGVDFACHGALSQRLFDEYRTEKESAKGVPLCHFSFRNKERLPNGTVYNRSAKIEFADGSRDLATRYNDAFLALYYNAKSPVRESCQSCKFAGERRLSDITLCDAWGIDKKHPGLNPFEGVSGICFNTAKGMEYVEAVTDRMLVFPCDFAFLKSHNDPFQSGWTRGATPTAARERLFGSVLSGTGFAACVKRYYSELGLK